MSKKITDFRGQYFSDQFNKLLERWKKHSKGRRRTDEDFARAIGKVHKKTPTRGTIGNWKNGVFPESYLPAICEVLGVNEEIFSPILPRDRLRYDEYFNDEKINSLRKYASHAGMNEDFLRFMKAMPDFPKVFPFEELQSKYGFEKHEVMERESIYQASDDYDHRLYLTEKDIDFIARLQSQTWSYMKALFLEEREKRFDELINYHCDIWSDVLNGFISGEEIKACITFPKYNWKGKHTAIEDMNLDQEALALTKEAYPKAIEKALREDPSREYKERTREELEKLDDMTFPENSESYEEMMKKYNLAHNRKMTSEQYDQWLTEVKQKENEEKEQYIDRLVEMEKMKKESIESIRKGIIDHGKH